jgi:E3 ubiquitin-protein ligase RAD18
MKLRRNWAVEEFVANFQTARKDILSFAQDAAQKAQDEIAGEIRQVKRRKPNGTRDAVNGTSSARRSTRSQTKLLASQASASQQSPVSTQNEIADSDEGSVYDDEASTSRHFDGPSDPEPNDGLVACPSCTRRLKETQINSHLDKCLAGEVPASSPPATNKPSSQSPRPPHVVSGTIAYSQTKPSTSNRLPTLNYSLFNDNAMRKKLKELGIPNTGSKQLMIKRHMEWLNLWNANCDSLNPGSKLQLLKDLTTWERTLGRQVEKGQQATGVMVKDFDRDRYAQKQKNDFDDLIARARQSRAARKPEDDGGAGQAETEDGTRVMPVEVDGLPETGSEHRPAEAHHLSAPAPYEEVETDRGDVQIPTTLTRPELTSPSLGWTSHAPIDLSGSSHQPPPSSQRSVSHDITA